MLKLLKYDFIQSYRTYGIVFAIYLVLCILYPFNFNNDILSGAFGISITLLIITIIVLLFNNLINYFQTSMFKESGYLTLTLPVSTHQIVLSKLITTFVWFFITGIVISIGALFNVMVAGYSDLGFTEAIKLVFSGILNALFYPEVIVTLLLAITNVLFAVLLIYFVITFVYSKFVRRNKSIVGIILILVISILVGLLSSYINSADAGEIYWTYAGNGKIYIDVLIKSILFNLGLSGFLYFGIVYIIDNMIEI